MADYTESTIYAAAAAYEATVGVAATAPKVAVAEPELTPAE